MKVSNFNTAIKVLILILVTSGTLCAQKKKKPAEEFQASGTRLREAEFYFTEGEKFFILEDFAKALSYYQRTLEITPNNATVHYKIAEVLSQSNRPEDLQKAATSIDHAINLEKKNKYFYLLAANIYSSLTRFDKAAQIYETMISEIRGTEEYLYELAAVYQYGNRFDEAIKSYNRAEAALGVSEISALQKQRLYLEQGKVKEALAEGEKLIKAYPHEERYIMGFTEILSQKGMRADAIMYLEKFLEENPEAGNTKMLLASLYRDNSQEQKARPLLLSLFDNPDVELTSKLLIIGAYNAELNIAKSKNVTDVEKQKFVESLFEKILISNPDEPNVHIVGGDLYLSIGKNKEAQREYFKAIQSGDVNFEVWQNLLFLDHHLEQFDQLIKHSDQALELFPNQGMLHYYNGYGHLRSRNFKQAIASFEQAKRLSATNPSFISEVNAMLGEAYNSLKEYEKSDKAYEEALSYNPENSTVLNNYSFFLATRKVNLDKAEKMATLLIKNSPDNPAFLDTYSWVLYVKGKYKEARKFIERAIATGKATATHFEHYGDILYKLGEVDAAVAQWEKARGMNADTESLNRKIANRKIYE